MLAKKLSDLSVSWVHPDTLTVYDRNARLHPQKKLKKLGQSVTEFGWTSPLVTDENDMVLCGAARLAAAKLVGLDRVPVIKLTHLTEAQKRALMLADNRIATEASWDKGLLAGEFAGLIELGFDTELTGFNTIEIDNALSFDAPSEPVDDDVMLPDEASDPVSRVGDLWHIGKHRALCGDARDLASYDRLLQGERAALIFTDPPFGCPIAGHVSGLGKVKHADFVMGAGEQSLPEFAQTLLRPAFRCMLASAASGAIAFICSDWRAAPHMQDAAQGIFHELKNLIVWVKDNAGMGAFYRSQHELIFAYKVSPGPHQNNFGLGNGGRHRANCWFYAGANTFRKGRMEDLAAHSTVKPKKLVSDAILDCSKRGAIVLDPFLGSGTTLASCELTGRVGRGIELDPKYMDVILQRVGEATGCEPLLDGVTPFSVVASERRGGEG